MGYQLNDCTAGYVPTWSNYIQLLGVIWTPSWTIPWGILLSHINGVLPNKCWCHESCCVAIPHTHGSPPTCSKCDKRYGICAKQSLLSLEHNQTPNQYHTIQKQLDNFNPTPPTKHIHQQRLTVLLAFRSFNTQKPTSGTSRCSGTIAAWRWGSALPTIFGATPGCCSMTLRGRHPRCA